MKGGAVAFNAEGVPILSRMHYRKIDAEFSFVNLSQNFESVPAKQVCDLYFKLRIIIVRNMTPRKTAIAETRCAF